MLCESPSPNIRCTSERRQCVASFLEPLFWTRTGSCPVFRLYRELACRFSRSNGVCWVLSSRPSDNTSRFRSQKNHPYRVDNERRGHASRNCHGSIEPKAADSAAKSSSSQLGRRGN